LAAALLHHPVPTPRELALPAMAMEQPKKPVGGAYGIFLTEKRPEFLKACAGQKASAVSTMAGAEWKKISDAAKAPYQKKYEQVKAKYDKDMAAFLAGGGEKTKGTLALRAEKRKAKDGKKKKDPNAPKKVAGGGYGVFLNENREKIVKSLPAGSNPITAVAKAAGEQWKALSEANKKPYVAKYEKKVAVYKAALEEYKKTLPAGEGDEEDDEEDEEGEEAEEKQPTPKKKAARK